MRVGRGVDEVSHDQRGGADCFALPRGQYFRESHGGQRFRVSREAKASGFAI
jgi:hypothetical protein